MQQRNSRIDSTARWLFSTRSVVRCGQMSDGCIAVEDRLYVTNQRGTTFVFRANPEKFELLAQNELGEGSNSTPAVSDGQIFIRTMKNVCCIEE